MDDQRLARIQQIRATLRKERRSFLGTAGFAVFAYIFAASMGPLDGGWVAFVIAVAASFLAVGNMIALSSWELEANLLEGPKTD